ncbi:MAG: NAD-dependent epimerase/dehydratase family protein [Planctomycetaceae bacterium]|nr:NAD-dependent epimerase/dehydratase family protein [Planctomycetaceae bacterium]
MKLLVTGACGFVGSQIIEGILNRTASGVEVWGLDNLCRRGSETNLARLQQLGVRFRHGDVRVTSDLQSFPEVDWVIDCSAQPSVLAGVDGNASSRQLVECNLNSTIELLELCRRNRSGFILLSTSRVYSINQLAQLPLKTTGLRFELDDAQSFPQGVSVRGLARDFSTQPPVSLYGATKLASEQLAIEYGLAYDFPVGVNRCGVLSGAGQFGRPDQGIVSYWIHSWQARSSLRYIGFSGSGRQVRDCLHVADLAELVWKQLSSLKAGATEVHHVSGGIDRSFSLAEMSAWCQDRFGKHTVLPDPTARPFDVPWLVLDSHATQQAWDWTPHWSIDEIFEDIAKFAEQHPEWLSRTV